MEQLALIAEYQNTFNAMYAEGLEIAKDKQKFEQDLEKLKLRPEFGFNGSTNNMYRFKNVGENADIISVDILEGINAISLHGIIKEQTIKKEQIFSIELNDRIEIEKRRKNKVRINFKDSIGTKYYQEINISMRGPKYKSEVSKVLEVGEEPIITEARPEVS